MFHRALGRLHAAAVCARGQGTVEYVGLILLVAVILAGVVTATRGAAGGAGIGAMIIKHLKGAIESVK
jgi:TRAP-type mannitol/chloroaromatic compound transport system permease large subunit